MTDRIIVVVFKMQGCPACAEYVPVFKRVAAPYQGRFPIHVLDVEDPRYQGLADRLGVSGVPATFVLRKPMGVIRAEGDLPPDQIRWMLDAATREASR